MGVISYLAWINLLVLVFNLVPAFPLDGGRVLRSILWAWKKNLRWATRIASGVGSAFAYLLIGYGVVLFITGNFVGGIWSFLIGLFLRSASRTSYQQILLREALAGEPVRRFMTANPVTVPPSTSVKAIIDDYLYRYPYKFYPVVGDGHLVGCITIDQLKQVPKEQWEQRTAESVAVPCSTLNMIDPEAEASEALAAMSRSQVSRLMVVEHGDLIGIVALKDLLRFFSRKLEFEGA